MSDEDPLLHKLDALLKKHRGDTESAAAPPAPAAPPPAAPLPDTSPPDVPSPDMPSPAAPAPGWLPVLTQVIERGSPPDPQSAPPAAEDAPGPATGPDAAAVRFPDDEAALVERLMQALAPRLTAIMEEQVAAALHRSLDQTVANLLAQLDVHVRETVRGILADALKHPPE